MRITSSILLIAASIINTVVSDGTVCFPTPCGTYTSQYPGSAPAQLTPWSQYIGLDKFDKQGGARTLVKVTLKTIFKFQTTNYVTCTNDVDYCNNDFTGTATSGVAFNIDLLTPSGKLGQYWGRWADYPYYAQGGSYTTPGNPPANNPALDITDTDNIVPAFVEYTYPLFDIIGYTPTLKTPKNGVCGQACTLWGYYARDEDGLPEYYYGTNAPGKIIAYDGFADPAGYRQDENTATGNIIYKYGQGGVATPKDTEITLGTETFDVTPTGLNTPYVKSISIGDANGGVGQDIPAQDMLDLFIADLPHGPQIYFKADATGFIITDYDGGVASSRQATTGFVQMAVEYEYTGSSIVQDPQFVGFQGQSFQVHGYPGSYFHLISAPTFQMNGRFTYLANGHCNYKHTPCWTHPGTYVDDVTLIVDELLVRITSGPVGIGYSVRINDEPFHAHTHANSSDVSHVDSREFVPTKFYDAATRLTIHLRSPLQLTIRTDLFAFTLNNADHFFNIDSQLLVRPILAAGREASSRYPHPTTGAPWFPDYPIHGFIGQTWANATYAHKKLYQGDVDDYVETRPYATESIYSQYKKQFDDKDMHWE